MGRRKKLHHKWKSKMKEPESKISSQEEDFRSMVEFCNYILPRQFGDWRRFFTTEARFLLAANKWLEEKVNGVLWPRIEDDMDKGLMWKTPSSPSHRSDVELDADVSYTEDDDYWSAWMHGAGYNSNFRGSSNWKGWSYSPALPATTTIDPPSGLAHIDLATVF